MTLAGVEDNLVSSVLPVGMQNSALEISDDEDENSISHELEIRHGGEQSISPTAINIEDSSDVIIGPVTHFNGPVTIYQSANGASQTNLQRNDLSNKISNEQKSSSFHPDFHFQELTDMMCSLMKLIRVNSRYKPQKDVVSRSSSGKLVKSESTSSETFHPVEKSSKNFILFRSKRVKYFIGFFLLLVIIVVVAIVTILSLKSEVPHSSPDRIGKNKTDMINKPGGDILKPAGPGEIINRENWGGRSALNFTRVLHHPIHFVIISHTATPFCKDFVVCSKRVQSIQDYHVGHLKSPDIGYNFLIGGDGNAYVGRGWDVRNFHSDDSIGISFIGNYLYDKLTQNMINIAKKLIKIGVEEGKLAEDYKLIGHNQTYSTQSPGPNAYEIIKTWPHYDSNYYFIS